MENNVMCNGDDQREQTNDKHLRCFTTLAAIACGVFLVLYLRLDVKKFTVDNNVLILFFGGIGLYLIPFASRIKIGPLELELKQLREQLGKVYERVEKVEALVRGEVVRDEHGNLFYIDDDEQRHHIPDNATASFLASPRGEVSVSTEDLAPYSLAKPMESVLGKSEHKCKLLHLERKHVFAVLNGKRYYVPSPELLIEWGRTKRELEPCDNEGLQKYPKPKGR